MWHTVLVQQKSIGQKLLISYFCLGANHQCVLLLNHRQLRSFSYYFLYFAFMRDSFLQLFFFFNYHFGDPLIYGFIHILIWYTFSAIIGIFFQVAFSCGLVFEVTSFCVWVSSWCILTVNVVSATFSLFWILRYIFCLIFIPEIPYLFF